MQPRGYEPGPVARFLAEDHQRLEHLLQTALAPADHVVRGAYDHFRAGLLRHIGMEEKILLPAAQRWNGGKPLSIAAKLRLDHGALAALLMPTPTTLIVATLRRILEQHNLAEESPDGWYEICDRLAGAEAEQLMTRLRATPEVAMLPHSDTAAVLGAVHRALERAGYTLDSDSR
ncbi:MAG TPA: hemerythrin domain-containing protein [Nitrospira sp.]|nr:hemerythrin domain-containing protein [Nitrospira sp.]